MKKNRKNLKVYADLGPADAGEEEERTFIRAMVQGMRDLEESREISLADAKKRLGLK